MLDDKAHHSYQVKKRWSRFLSSWGNFSIASFWRRDIRQEEWRARSRPSSATIPDPEGTSWRRRRRTKHWRLWASQGPRGRRWRRDRDLIAVEVAAELWRRQCDVSGRLMMVIMWWWRPCGGSSSVTVVWRLVDIVFMEMAWWCGDGAMVVNHYHRWIDGCVFGPLVIMVVRWWCSVLLKYKIQVARWWCGIVDVMGVVWLINFQISSSEVIFDPFF